jgi:DNA polymerase-3 subunit epsilon
MRCAIIFDTETTGLTLHPDAPIQHQPKIIEFGAVLMSLEDGSVVDTINILIDPGEPITPEITKITGITTADVEGAPKFNDVVADIAVFFGRAEAMVAHNLPFDRSIMEIALKRGGVEGFVFPARSTCTVGLYREQWGRNPKLTELYAEVMGEPLEQTHRALDDVMAMVEIIQKESIWAMF